MTQGSARKARLALLAAYLLGVSSSRAQPNIIVFQPDDLTHFWEDAPRSSTTSAIGRLAARDVVPRLTQVRDEAAVFVNAYASSPMCAPSRFSTNTGRYASRGIYAQGRTDAACENTTVTVPSAKLTGADLRDNLPTALQSAGYRTIHAGKWHLEAAAGRRPSYTGPVPFQSGARALPKRGTALWADYDARVAAVRSAGYSVAASVYFDNLGSSGGEFSHNMEWVTAGAVNAMGTAVQDSTPFFLYFNPTVPHSPSTEDALFKYELSNTPAGAQTFTNLHPPRKTVWDRATKLLPNSPDKVAASIWVDDSMGVLYDQLETTGQLEDTLLLFMMDHGVLAKGGLYEGGIRVAMFARFPKKKYTSAVLSAVSNVDLAPTLAAFANVRLSFATDGSSWLSMAAGEERSVPYMAERNNDSALVAKIGGRVMKLLVKTNSSSLSARVARAYPSSSDAVQLYDLSVDAREQKKFGE